MMLRALFVGIDHYCDPRIEPLRYCVKDAMALADRLRATVSAADLSATVLVDEQATRRQILETIGTDLARAIEPDDIVLVYFAGHGSSEASPPHDRPGDQFLVAHDTSYDGIYSTGIGLRTTMIDLFARLRSRFVLFVLDTCFSGAAGGRTFGLPESRGSAARRRIPLSELRPGEGRIILTACTDEQVARETRQHEHGLFTYHLLRVLGDPRAKGKQLSVGNLYDSVYAAVVKDTDGQQQPTMKGSNTGMALPYLRPL